MVHNMVIDSKKWDPSKIHLTLDTRMMGNSNKQVHFPIPNSEQTLVQGISPAFGECHEALRKVFNAGLSF